MMNSDSHKQSIKLFFTSFAKHLEKIRDEGKDANQAYRAQILLSQLQQFEIAVGERADGPSPDGLDLKAFRTLFTAQDLGSVIQWIADQPHQLGVKTVFFLDQKATWQRMLGEDPLPERIRVGEWIQRGTLAKLAQPETAYVAYVFGQPRLVVMMNGEEDPNPTLHLQFAQFVGRLLPLFLDGQVKETGHGSSGHKDIIAHDAGFLEVLDLIKKAASKDVSILLEGESGSGKEVVAQFVHQHSNRSSKQLVAVNCAAIPAGLIESELFGHEKGAFTGAYNRQIGRVEEADGGTLFLDEIGEMELAMQAKLLRFLQLHEFHRVGGKQKISVNVRIVAATNRNLKNLVAEGKFREDLYYRLSVMPFAVPALRDRIDDILPLARFFLRKYATVFNVPVPQVEDQVYQVLAAYHFPGNVRELENIIQNILVVSQGSRIQTRHLPAPLHRLEPSGVPVSDGNGRPRRWQRRAQFWTKLRLPRLNQAVGEEKVTMPWDQTLPLDNDELKLVKQQIQDYANELTLRLEQRFLDHLLERADGSMPEASRVGKINRTLLYKMLDRTKHLREDR